MSKMANRFSFFKQCLNPIVAKDFEAKRSSRALAFFLGQPEVGQDRKVFGFACSSTTGEVKNLRTWAFQSPTGASDSVFGRNILQQWGKHSEVPLK